LPSFKYSFTKPCYGLSPPGWVLIFNSQQVTSNQFTFHCLIFEGVSTLGFQKSFVELPATILSTNECRRHIKLSSKTSLDVASLVEVISMVIGLKSIPLYIYLVIDLFFTVILFRSYSCVLESTVRLVSMIVNWILDISFVKIR
jgi:hypothetical protein